MTRKIINVKINKVMTRKKRTKEEQPLTTEVVGAKKEISKEKESSKRKACYCSRTGSECKRAYYQKEAAENTPEKREYTIDELIDMLGPDIECEDEAEVEDTSSSEKEDNGEDIFAALDDWNGDDDEEEDWDGDDDEEEISDEIIDLFDKTLEAKGLGDAYFDRLERRIREHKEAQKERELYIDEVLNEE